MPASLNNFSELLEQAAEHLPEGMYVQLWNAAKDVYDEGRVPGLTTTLPVLTLNEATANIPAAAASSAASGGAAADGAAAPISSGRRRRRPAAAAAAVAAAPTAAVNNGVPASWSQFDLQKLSTGNVETGVLAQWASSCGQNKILVLKDGTSETHDQNYLSSLCDLKVHDCAKLVTKVNDHRLNPWKEQLQDMANSWIFEDEEPDYAQVEDWERLRSTFTVNISEGDKEDAGYVRVVFANWIPGAMAITATRLQKYVHMKPPRTPLNPGWHSGFDMVKGLASRIADALIINEKVADCVNAAWDTDQWENHSNLTYNNDPPFQWLKPDCGCELGPYLDRIVVGQMNRSGEDAGNLCILCDNDNEEVPVRRSKSI